MHLITIASFTEPLSAHIARGRLSAEDVFSCINHEQHVWANWMMSNALGGVKLQVLYSDKERAQNVLNEMWAGEYEETLLPYFLTLNDDECPSCGSRELNHQVSLSSTLFLFFILFFIGFAYPPTRDIVICQKCSHKWKEVY